MAAVYCPPEKLTELLREPKLRDLFRCFCVDELAGENFAFWEDVEHFQSIDDVDERGRRFNAMYEKYFSVDSEHELSMGGEDRIKVEKCRKTGNITRDVFDDLQLQIWVGLNTELFPRFIQSQYLQRYVENKNDPEGLVHTRKKLEEFFGMSLVGPIHREELVKVVEAQGARGSDHQRRLKQKSGGKKKSFWRPKHTGPSHNADTMTQSEIVIRGKGNMSGGGSSKGRGGVKSEIVGGGKGEGKGRGDLTEDTISVMETHGSLHM